jgi:pimeloyl-ACP methyl ester carboxylesterase
VNFLIDGHKAHAATGGRNHVSGRPLALFVHGAGLDHTVWALQSRWLAFRGWNVLALDLPGHGHSGGRPLTNVGAMADWVLGAIDATGSSTAALIGHSMGSLIALEAASRAPSKVRSLLLVGTAAAMPVHPDLLAAAAANSQDAIDMVNLWGYGYRAGLGGSAAPGMWMTGAGDSILRRALPGVLHSDLAACDAYKTGLDAAARITIPTLIVAGQLDQMTPLKSARTLAAAVAGSTLTVLRGAGHMLLAEEPDALIEAMGEHLVRRAARAP